MLQVYHTWWLSGDTPMHLLRAWRYNGYMKEELMSADDSKYDLRGDCREVLTQLISKWVDEWFNIAVTRYIHGDTTIQFDHDDFVDSVELKSFPLHLTRTTHLTNYIDSLVNRFHEKRVCPDIICYEYGCVGKHLNYLFYKSLCDSAIKTIRKVSRVWTSICRDLLLSPRKYVSVPNLYRRFEQRFGKCLPIRILVHHIPFEQTITFIQCMHPRVKNEPALADALEGVFGELFISTLLPMFVIYDDV